MPSAKIRAPLPPVSLEFSSFLGLGHQQFSPCHPTPWSCVTAPPPPVVLTQPAANTIPHTCSQMQSGGGEHREEAEQGAGDLGEREDSENCAGGTPEQKCISETSLGFCWLPRDAQRTLPHWEALPDWGGGWFRAPSTNWILPPHQLFPHGFFPAPAASNSIISVF